MKTGITLIGGLLAAGVIATTAISQNDADPAIMAAVKARQAHMQLNAFNIGVLGAMAKGEIPYDAEVASAAAGNLAALSQMNEARYWPPGSDNVTLGDEATEALPVIWEDGGKVMEKAMAMAEAAAGLNEVAGGGLDALRAGMGPVGKACGGCHETYRKKSEN
ncbi:MAG: cytochrome c [Sedimentitalea sp.]|nr:cytochrome c [Sedimentitalea sp.]